MNPVINKKLQKLLLSLSEKEVAEFRKFVSSPIYSKKRNYKDILRRIINTLKEPSDRKSKSHSVFPKRYNAQTIKNRQSELLKLGMEFLVYRKLSSDKIEKEKLLLKSLIERNLHEFFTNRIGTAERYAKALPIDDSRLRTEDELTLMKMLYMIKSNDFKSFYPLFFQNSFDFTCMALIRLFDNGIEFSQQLLTNKKFEFNIAVEIIRNIDLTKMKADKKFINSTVYQFALMYQYLYNAYDKPDNETFYFESRKIFKKIEKELSSDLKLKLYRIFVYYCIRKQNAGSQKFKLELFSLFNEKLKAGFISDFSENNYPMNSFRDYALIAVELGEFNWARDFIEKYHVLLPMHIRDDEMNISYANIEFESGNYEESLRYLKNAGASNFIHYIDSSRLKLCCYYELGLSEDSYYEIDRLIHYLKSHNEIPKDHKTNMNNFVKIYRKILIAKNDPEFKDFNLINELDSMRIIPKRKWFVEKIRSMGIGN